jgi:hypothetical protein
MYDIFLSATFVAMILVPCVLTLTHTDEEA